MDLQHLVQIGFHTQELCRGGDEERQDPKFLASRNQAVLMDKLRRLYMAVAQIDADETLSETGKTQKKTQLATKTLSDIEGETARLRGLIETKGATARNRLAQVSRPAGESDIDRLGRMLSVQNQQHFLLALDAQGLLGELARAVRDGDTTTYEAIASLPTFVLREKSITKEMIDASRREWSRRVDPGAAADMESAEVMARLVNEDLATAQRAIRDHCGLPEQDKIRTL